ncbi:hypothetical protein PR048_003542 [Dryococelus australis]|uniref:Uncharacterized protein n=1 Tax=Dryococelus australis TaxID=614101 RepID=A0ABQ9INC7_9NEOP|nr:hypothetical protein PR048_003542 [Dryococelus australis]
MEGEQGSPVSCEEKHDREKFTRVSQPGLVSPAATAPAPSAAQSDDNRRLSEAEFARSLLKLHWNVLKSAGPTSSRMSPIVDEFHFGPMLCLDSLQTRLWPPSRLLYGRVVHNGAMINIVNSDVAAPSVTIPTCEKPGNDPAGNRTRFTQRYDGNTARHARRSDEVLGVRVSVARIAPSFLGLGRTTDKDCSFSLANSPLKITGDRCSRCLRPPRVADTPGRRRFQLGVGGVKVAGRCPLLLHQPDLTMIQLAGLCRTIQLPRAAHADPTPELAACLSPRRTTWLVSQSQQSSSLTCGSWLEWNVWQGSREQATRERKKHASSSGLCCLSAEQIRLGGDCFPRLRKLNGRKGEETHSFGGAPPQAMRRSDVTRQVSPHIIGAKVSSYSVKGRSGHAATLVVGVRESVPHRTSKSTVIGHQLRRAINHANVTDGTAASLYEKGHRIDRSYGWHVFAALKRSVCVLGPFSSLFLRAPFIYLLSALLNIELVLSVIFFLAAIDWLLQLNAFESYAQGELLNQMLSDSYVKQEVCREPLISERVKPLAFLRASPTPDSGLVVRLLAFHQGKPGQEERGSDTGDTNTHGKRLIAPTRKAHSVSVLTLSPLAFALSCAMSRQVSGPLKDGRPVSSRRGVFIARPRPRRSARTDSDNDDAGRRPAPNTRSTFHIADPGRRARAQLDDGRCTSCSECMHQARAAGVVVRTGERLRTKAPLHLPLSLSSPSFHVWAVHGQSSAFENPARDLLLFPDFVSLCREPGLFIRAGKKEIPEKIRRTAASPGMIRMRENLGTRLLAVFLRPPPP